MDLSNYELQNEPELTGLYSDDDLSPNRSFLYENHLEHINEPINNVNLDNISIYINNININDEYRNYTSNNVHSSNNDYSDYYDDLSDYEPLIASMNYMVNNNNS